MAQIKGIALVSKSGFELFIAGFAAPVKFVYPPNTFAYYELTNTAQLDAALKQFITANKIPAGQILFIASSELLFQKLTTIKDPVAQKEDLDKLIDKIPFETTISKTLPEPNGVRIVALNGTFFNILATVFEKNGFSCLGIQIDFQASPTLAAKNTLDAAEIDIVLRNFDTLQKTAFPCMTVEHEDTIGPALAVEEHIDQKPKSQLPLLIGVFVVLVAVLIFVLLRQ